MYHFEPGIGRAEFYATAFFEASTILAGQNRVMLATLEGGRHLATGESANSGENIETSGTNRGAGGGLELA